MTVLRTIDHAIPFPVLFELVGGRGRYKAALILQAAHGCGGGVKWVVSDHLRGAWVDRFDSPRGPYLWAVSLGVLYDIKCSRRSLAG